MITTQATALRRAAEGALAELKEVLESIGKDKVHFDGDEFHERFKALEAALAVAATKVCIDAMCACRGGPCAEYPEGDAVAAEAFVRDLLWNDHPECCGSPVVGAEYMGSREIVCCGNPEPASLNEKQIVASLRERFPEAAAILATKQEPMSPSVTSTLGWPKLERP